MINIDPQKWTGSETYKGYLFRAKIIVALVAIGIVVAGFVLVDELGAQVDDRITVSLYVGKGKDKCIIEGHHWNTAADCKVALANHFARQGVQTQVFFDGDGQYRVHQKVERGVVILLLSRATVITPDTVYGPPVLWNFEGGRP